MNTSKWVCVYQKPTQKNILERFCYPTNIAPIHMFKNIYNIICFKTAQFIQIIMDQKLVSHYMSEKAGMQKVDAKSIAEKVAQLTAGTPKDLHEKEMEKKRTLEVTDMLSKVLNFTSEQKIELRNYWEGKIQTISSGRQLDRIWAHLDFDMFYVACELLSQPELVDQPCAVGGDQSVLSTANYVARKFGVRSAMPTFIAKKICPQLILFKPDFQKYRKFSDIFRTILREFDENLESHGLDEAYIDITQFMKDKSFSQQQDFIQNIRKRIFQATGLTVSCGVGANKMLAKLASEERKPNNQFILPNQQSQILQYMKRKKIRKIPGIGPVNEFYLKGLGIQTASDLLSNTDTLAICFSEGTCEFFVQSALGIGSIEHQFKQRKSVGKSETFRPTSDQQFLILKLKQLCEQVSMQLQELGFLSINVVFSYQSDAYEKKDKTFKLLKYTSDKEQLFQAIIDFLKNEIHKRLRLIGVKCSALIKEQEWKKQSIYNFLNLKRGSPKKTHKIQEKVKKQVPKQKQKEVLADKKEDKKDTGKSLFQEIRQNSEFICPICNQEVKCFKNLTSFNRHVDKCLEKMNPPENQKSIKQNHTQKQGKKQDKKKGKSRPKNQGLDAFLKKPTN